MENILVNQQVQRNFGKKMQISVYSLLLYSKMKIVRYFLLFCQEFHEKPLKKKKKHNFVKLKWLYIEKYYMIKCNKNSYKIFIGTTLYHWMLILIKTYIWHWQHDYAIICFKILITLNSSREVFAKGVTIFHLYVSAWNWGFVEAIWGFYIEWFDNSLYGFIWFYVDFFFFFLLKVLYEKYKYNFQFWISEIIKFGFTMYTFIFLNLI